PSTTAIYTLSLHDALPIYLLNLRVALVSPFKISSNYFPTANSGKALYNSTFLSSDCISKIFPLKESFLETFSKSACLKRPTSSRSEEHTSELQSQSNLVCR